MGEIGAAQTLARRGFGGVALDALEVSRATVAAAAPGASPVISAPAESVPSEAPATALRIPFLFIERPLPGPTGDNPLR